MAIQRAPKGGAYGANGEWYEGGKFIATTKHPKRHGSYKPKGRVEIEPYVYAERREGFAPIWGKIEAYAKQGEDGKYQLIEAGLQGLRAMWGDKAETTILHLQLHVSYFNNGYRWVQIKPDGEITYTH